MATSTSTLGRPADRTRLIVRELRRRIVSGSYEPGGQLPTRSEIEEHFGAGATTVQRALEQLRRDGFIQVNGRQGTYVVPNPPHLTRYAIVFADSPGRTEWPRFWTALNHEVVNLEESQTRPEALQLPVYYGVNKDDKTEDYDRLVQEVQEHLVAGLIFTSTPFMVAHTPLLDEAGVPRVAVMGTDGDPNIPVVSLDVSSFRTKAVAYLAGLGRRRIAVIGVPTKHNLATEWAPFIAAGGLETRPYWFQTVHRNSTESARNCLHLLMHPGQDVRPDAIVIADDNLLEHGTEGLVAAGVRGTDDVSIVAHCNFPWPTPSHLPVTRLGFDARRVVAKCIEVIDQQRAGMAVPRVTVVEAVFEGELGL